MCRIYTIRALGDNLVHFLQYEKQKAAVVDPSDAGKVTAFLGENELELTDIFVTHHHWDHTAGASRLQDEFDCRIVAAENISDGDKLVLGKTEIRIIATPGHTRDSICYFVKFEQRRPAVFTGDTLFTGGCGRIFEGDAETMWNSLLKLRSLPDEADLYCGHDYTVENYEFALSIEPDSRAVRNILCNVKNIQKQNSFYISTIAEQKQTNPFLRADDLSFKKTLNIQQKTDWEVFSFLRGQKDNF